jgi:hypothetical protein
MVSTSFLLFPGKYKQKLELKLRWFSINKENIYSLPGNRHIFTNGSENPFESWAIRLRALMILIVN